MSDSLPESGTAQLESDHDSPWKSALEVFFRPCMELLFLVVAAKLDLTVGPEFLD